MRWIAMSPVTGPAAGLYASAAVQPAPVDVHVCVIR